MKASCTCHSAPDLCAAGVIERPCYYPGQLLTPAEMTLEQQYFRDKLRRHNRLMHGWGVVYGYPISNASGRARQIAQSRGSGSSLIAIRIRENVHAGTVCPGTDIFRLPRACPDRPWRATSMPP